LDSLSFQHHRTGSLEHLNPDVMWPGGFATPRRVAVQHLLLLLSIVVGLLRLLAEYLSLQSLFVGIILGLFAHVELVLFRRGIDVVQVPLVFHRCNYIWWKLTDLLLLLRRGRRFDLETRLREQGLFLNDSLARGLTRY